MVTAGFEEGASTRSPSKKMGGGYWVRLSVRGGRKKRAGATIPEKGGVLLPVWEHTTSGGAMLDPLIARRRRKKDRHSYTVSVEGQKEGRGLVKTEKRGGMAKIGPRIDKHRQERSSPARRQKKRERES